MVRPQGVHALDDGVRLDEEVGVDPLVDLELLQGCHISNKSTSRQLIRNPDLLRHAVRHLDVPVDVQLDYACRQEKMSKR